ncbi:hypothetical protein [Amycolatopsis saalfeldensis]|uniref:Cellulase (Glycosyl hydrolase family 5) n=1 Tax=Amycolatopsis saalfeldensis TaxID=394193 RepID=A0A1H8YMA6_9PSEU|nr:hypothetical protein [Amycolatopsis saalfeldensis]SEP53289.1 hypothetical protein SAMN04489732_12612 [Amycolatopsis saalfeldensis]
MKRRLALGLTLAALSSACPGPAAAATPVTTGRGGSDYAFYQVDHDAPGVCDREPYGVVNSYDKAPEVIKAQLAQMYVAGQRRLRIPVFYQHGPDSGTVMDSTGGTLSAKNRKNLADLLAAVKAAGFQEIEVAFFPIGVANPGDWTSWNEAQYQEDRSVIEAVRPIVRASGVPYLLDLLNEGMPMTGQTVPIDYAHRLWADYTAAHGKADTVGFSMTVWIADRARQIPAVYGGNVPTVFDIHLYGDVAGGNGDEYSQFVDARKELAGNGYNQGWIIGEGYYNDSEAADGIARAIHDTGQVVFYLTQWPLTRGHTCSDVDVAPPVAFDGYLAKGF